MIHKIDSIGKGPTVELHYYGHHASDYHLQSYSVFLQCYSSTRRNEQKLRTFHFCQYALNESYSNVPIPSKLHCAFPDFDLRYRRKVDKGK